MLNSDEFKRKFWPRGSTACYRLITIKKIAARGGKKRERRRYGRARKRLFLKRRGTGGRESLLTQREQPLENRQGDQENDHDLEDLHPLRAYDRERGPHVFFQQVELLLQDRDPLRQLHHAQELPVELVEVHSLPGKVGLVQHFQVGDDVLVERDRLVDVGDDLGSLGEENPPKPARRHAQPAGELRQKLIDLFFVKIEPERLGKEHAQDLPVFFVFRG